MQKRGVHGQRRRGAQPTQALGFTRGNVAIRLLDQGLWSAASFAFYLVTAMFLSVSEYASVTVCSSIGVIVAAAVRAYAVDGRVIAGARNGHSSGESLERKSLLMSGLAGALGASLLSFIWLLAANSVIHWWLPVLAGAIVLADGPHYAYTMYGLFRRAAYVASVYAVLAGILFVLSYREVPLPLVLTWVIALGAVWIIGLAGPIPWKSSPFATLGVSLRLSGEALYSALGSQLGILVIFITSPPDDTAGIRLAYSLVFAPIFMLIQGLQPLLLSRMAQLHTLGGASQLRLLWIWISFSGGGVVVSGIAGAALALSMWQGTNFGTVLPFLLPVGAAMLGSLLLDSVMLPMRFTVAPKVPHRIRLAMVSGEACVQITLALVWGTQGLVVALMIGFLAKVVLACVLALRIGHARKAVVSETQPMKGSRVG